MKSRNIVNLTKHIIIIFLILLTFFPFFFMAMTSFKSIYQFYHSFWLPALPLHFENFGVAWGQLRGYVMNSVLITTSGTIGTVALCSLSAFVFARVDFRFKGILFYLMISIMMIPPVLVLVPLFMWMKTLKLLNTRIGLILSYVAMGQPFGIFVLRSFFEAVPKEIFESAKIDGASFFQLFRSIGVPLSKHILGALAIINILYIWNDYLWPQVVISSNELRPITTGLMVYYGQYNVQYGFLMAGCVIASLPLIILFLFTMKYFVAGLMSGALKM